MRVIYTSKGMSKKFGVRVIIRCVLSIEKYVMRVIYTSKGMSKEFGVRVIH